MLALRLSSPSALHSDCPLLALQLFCEMPGQRRRGGRCRQRNGEIAGLRHAQARIGTRIDQRKRRQIHVDVETDAVITTVPAHPQAKCRNLGRADIDPRRAAMSLGADTMRCV